MDVFSSLAILGVAFVTTPGLTRVLGRNAGWPLALLYLAAAAAQVPAAVAVAAGEHPSWAVDWIPALGIRLSFAVDGLGLVFSYIALLIGAVVFVYSTRYLPVGRSLSFYQVMTAFTLSMQALVLSDDMVVLFICWELTSLASFLLIARSGHGGEGASMRTLLITFVGGVLLLLAVVAIWWRTGTTSLAGAFAHDIWATDPAFTTAMAVLVALAGFTKAAQFPFHVWLPDAMAAITPVSAYLHAAAVVKAGIFLLLRFSPVFQGNGTWSVLLLGVGLLTACLGGYFALEQTDVKKLMAYSTVSQLGLLTASIGLGTQAGIAAAVLHTIAHALFKSGLFMMVGVVDHATHTRDLRRFPPRLHRRMPVSFGIMTLGCASMAGIPPMLGFLSKEAILGSLLGAPGASWTGWAAFTVAALGSVLTFAYCARVVLGVFVDGTDEERQITASDPVLVASAGLPILVSIPLVCWLPGLEAPVSLATLAATGSEPHLHLSLWHGVNAELVATGVIITVGVFLAWLRRPLISWVLEHRFPVQGARVMEQLAEWTRRLGSRLDQLVASDTPTRSVIPIVGCLGVIGIVGSWLAYLEGLPEQLPGLTQPVDVLLFVLITAAVIGVCISQVRLAAVLSMSAVGILVTVQILAFGAPDVAMTQLLVESLNIIVIMLVLQKLPVRFPRRPRRGTVLTLGASLLVGGGVAGLTWALVARREKSPLAETFLQQTKAIASGDNVVNVILVEFRAFDTLGELSVLAMAAIAIMALLSTVRDKHIDPPLNDPDLVPVSAMNINQNPKSRAHRAIMDAWPNAVSLQVMLRFMTPLLVVISAVLFWRGHNSPGGGFNAALVAASIVGLIYLSTAKDRQVGPPRLPLFLIGGGVTLAVATGFFDLLIAGSFLEPIHGEILGVHLTTSMAFDAGVYSAVLGLILVSINVLGTTRGTTAGGEGIRERIDESLEGELPGPLETVRGERPRRPAIRTRFIADGNRPEEAPR
jgi:putative monovalent cation/H+ antiporter subunit A